jgi:hypothetical protein
MSNWLVDLFKLCIKTTSLIPISSFSLFRLVKPIEPLNLSRFNQTIQLNYHRHYTLSAWKVYSNSWVFRTTIHRQMSSSFVRRASATFRTNLFEAGTYVPHSSKTKQRERENSQYFVVFTVFINSNIKLMVWILREHLLNHLLARTIETCKKHSRHG